MKPVAKLLLSCTDSCCSELVSCSFTCQFIHSIFICSLPAIKCPQSKCLWNIPLQLGLCAARTAGPSCQEGVVQIVIVMCPYWDCLYIRIWQDRGRPWLEECRVMNNNWLYFLLLLKMESHYIALVVWNWICRPRWPQTSGSACLLSAGLKGVSHHTCPGRTDSKLIHMASRSAQ